MRRGRVESVIHSWPFKIKYRVQAQTHSVSFITAGEVAAAHQNKGFL